jgi:hypothetical protein
MVSDISVSYGRKVYHVTFYPVGEKVFTLRFDADEIELAASMNWSGPVSSEMAGFQENPPDLASAGYRNGKFSKVMGQDESRKYGKNSSHKTSIQKSGRIPLKEFEPWLRANGSQDEVKRYEETKEAYKQFHHGTEPRTITRRLVDIGAGGEIVGRSFTYSMGKSPFESYITPKGSKKGDDTPYLHEYETQPEGLATAGGKTIIKPLDGSAYIGDWIHG